MARPGTFKKGCKGGPGRPPGSGRIPICEAWADKKGFPKLIEIAEGKGYKAGMVNGVFREVGPTREMQLQAMKLLIAYGKGNPITPTQISGPEGRPIQVDEVKRADLSRLTDKTLVALSEMNVENVAEKLNEK